MTPKENLTRQKYLGSKGMVIFISIMSMFPALSTDLYLPALPTMSVYFKADSSLINLTLVSFFFCFAVGTIFFGPISDKYGRRRVLLLGSVVYAATSATCALATNIYLMIIARVFQGLGAGSMASVSMALAKDCFEGEKREKILAIVQTFSGIAPMVAPVLGAFILKFTDWHGGFWVLSIVGIMLIVLSLLFRETLDPEERTGGSPIAIFGRLFKVAKNVGFIVPVIIFSFFNFAFIGYVSVSSYIYIDFFGLSEQAYSYFFAANALLMPLGPIIYVRFFLGVNKTRLAYTCFIVYALCGLGLLLVGQSSPVLFWLCFAPFGFFGTLSRPFSASMLLEQQRGDSGSASSLINGMATIFGSIGMTLITFWSNHIIGLGEMALFSGVAAFLGWFLILRSSVRIVGIKE